MYSVTSGSIILWTIVILQSILWTSAQNSYEEDEATIHLFYYPNARNPSEKYELDLTNPSSFRHPNLAKGKRAKILIHGANGYCSANSFPNASIEAYLKVKATGREDHNVFCLEYRKIANISTYSEGIPGNRRPTPRQLYEYVVNIVGNKTARFILALEEQGIVSGLDQVHIIGHSLGGQVSGVAGRKVLEMTGCQRRVGRITGLDVANVYNFFIYKKELNLRNQIDSSDATFVDIVHTNDGLVGLKGDYGRVDYYPDGGQYQRACLQKPPMDNLIERLTGRCSHGIVGAYWADSIENGTITACKASSYEDFKNQQNSLDSGECPEENRITFGEYVPLSAFGQFYLDMV